jgi:hypothetical protein
VGSRVIVSEMETGKDVPLLANTRWRLLERTPQGWQRIDEAEGYRQREPCVLATDAKSTVFLNVNDSTTPPGTKYGACDPYLLAYDLSAAPPTPRRIAPAWTGTPNFTDHSYRGFAADATAGRLLMFNIDAKTSVQNWCLLTMQGKALRNGSISFPIRACYPQAALQNGGAHILAVGDIVEPIEEWRKYKFDQTQSTWDYVFRILYYAATPDLEKQDFAAPIEIANVDKTAGYIGNQDLWIAPNGDAYILYAEREVASALLRDKFFPGKSVINSLQLVVVRNGAVIERRTVIAGTDAEQAGHARFHVTPEGTVYGLTYLTGSQARDVLMQVYPAIEKPEMIPVPFKTPFTSFLLASVRAGNAPSRTIDVLGIRTSGETISYGEVIID